MRPGCSAWLLVGVLLAAALAQTRASAPAVARRRADLDRPHPRRRPCAYDTATARRAALQAQVDAAEDRGSSRTTGRRARRWPPAGRAGAGSPGRWRSPARACTVTLDDAATAAGRRPTRALDRVLDRDLQSVVNGLWAAGAEAVAVNGQRLTALSAIRSAGDAILVDYRPLTRPYVVVAIGDPRTIAGAVRFSGGPAGPGLRTLQQTYGMQVRRSTASTASRSRPRRRSQLRYAEQARLAVIAVARAGRRHRCSGWCCTRPCRCGCSPTCRSRSWPPSTPSSARCGRRSTASSTTRSSSISFVSNVVVAALIVFLGDQLGVGAQLSTGVSWSCSASGSSPTSPRSAGTSSGPDVSAASDRATAPARRPAGSDARRRRRAGGRRCAARDPRPGGDRACCSPCSASPWRCRCADRRQSDGLSTAREADLVRHPRRPDRAQRAAGAPSSATCRRPRDQLAVRRRSQRHRAAGGAQRAADPRHPRRHRRRPRARASCCTVTDPTGQGRRGDRARRGRGAARRRRRGDADRRPVRVVAQTVVRRRPAAARSWSTARPCRRRTCSLAIGDPHTLAAALRHPRRRRRDRAEPRRRRRRSTERASRRRSAPCDRLRRLSTLARTGSAARRSRRHAQEGQRPCTPRRPASTPPSTSGSAAPATAARAGRHHRLRPGRARRHRLRSLPAVGDERHRRRSRAASSSRPRASATSTPRSPARSSPRNEALDDDPGAGQHRPVRRRLAVRGPARPTRPRSTGCSTPPRTALLSVEASSPRSESRSTGRPALRPHRTARGPVEGVADARLLGSTSDEPAEQCGTRAARTDGRDAAASAVAELGDRRLTPARRTPRSTTR